MSDNIYDIIGKLNGLGPKDNPVSTSAEPVYESIDPDDITPAVNSLEEKYQNFLIEETAKKSQSQKDADLTRGEPELVKLVHKARLERPTAASDAEALAYQMVKANKELAKATAANDEQEQKIADLDAKVAALSTAKPEPVAEPTPTPAAVAQPTAAAPTTAPAARPSATILRMPTPATAEIPAQAEIPTQAPATDEVPAQVKPARTDKSAGEKKPAVDKKVTPGDVEIPDELAQARAKKAARLSAVDVSGFTPVGQAVGQDFTPEKQENKLMKDMLKESIEMLKEYKEGDPNLGIYNYNDMLKKFQSGQQKITLNFGPGKDLTLYDYQMYGILAELGSDQNQERKVQRIENVMSSYEAVVNALMLPRVKKYISLFPEFASKSPVFKARKRDIEQNKFTLDPTTKKDPGEPPRPQPHPYQQGDSQLEENVGNDTMQENIKTNSILEGVRQVEEKYMGFDKTVAAIKKGGSAEDPEAVAAAIGRKKYGKAKFQKAAAAGKKLGEEAKPDFLDLDKDGDTEEPMKKAAKDAKEHEPAKPDSDAVAKRKRLQALKDKQEDERAERGDDDKSSSRIVKGRAYGGAAQKDDEEKDLDESGLQAYLGKKKYGKEGMRALQKAGREGASKEKMAMLRAKHDKFDESAKPDYIDLDKDGNKTEPMKKAAKEKKAKPFSSDDYDEYGVRHSSSFNQPPKKVDEVAPPGAKAERMVKHIKKGYAKDGELTKREKGIAYATAWKAHNKGQVEEGTEFGDTIKNSEAKMTKVKVTEGKEAIRNHPIYTNEEAWNHYKQELDEQEAMEADCMEAPVVDVQEELNEIARLAGLAPKMEAKSVCPSCKCEKCECNENLDPMVPADSASPLTHTEEGMGCSMKELKEAMSRKNYREMAEKIKNMTDREDAKKICKTFADMAKADNPRFKEEMFYAACGIDVAECGMAPATVLVGEEEMDEGNEFTKARLDAIAAGKDTFTVGGKTYKVSGDTSAEKTQVESIDDEKQAVTENMNITVAADGEEDVVNLIRKLSGMPVVAIQAAPAEESCGTCGSTPCGCDSLEEERDIEWDNTPEEKTAPITAVTTDAGGGLGGVKKQYPLAANRGANPIEENLWKAYEDMINDVKV